LEKRKLAAEVASLELSDFRKPSFYVSSATLALAVLALVLQAIFASVSLDKAQAETIKAKTEFDLEKLDMAKLRNAADAEHEKRRQALVELGAQLESKQSDLASAGQTLTLLAGEKLAASQELQRIREEIQEIRNTAPPAVSAKLDRLDARAGKVIENLKVYTPFRVSNLSGAAIIVVMDSNREVHTIIPKSTALFTNLLLFDRPTFKVYEQNADGSRGKELAREAFHTTGLLPRSLQWDGQKLERAIRDGQ
jgi:hypothetical protein